mmetsp:Transcript_34834/g.74239  ORF Transcript_34834/g.74239 Transcript_34834/m.74239 type:complete len:1045 (-) Transcript_34834:149-3283(-)
MSRNDESVERACDALHKSVGNLISKIEKRKRRRGEEAEDAGDEARECRRLVLHANHVLRTLTAKRTSLKHAIEAFGEASRRRAEEFSDPKGRDGDAAAADDDSRRHEILRGWFACYLRLRDGFVLLESGERRHPRDGDGADRSGASSSDGEFSSRLSDAYRRDGVTRKFSSRNGYTGAGYDEAYDDDAGIRRRLLDALSRMDGAWSREDVLERTFDRDGNGARAWEIEMDEHINESISLREDLNSIQKRFVNDVNEHLTSARHRNNKKEGVPDKLKLVTDDKSERITLGLVDIARQGNAFTIKDAGGSLPFGMTVQDWRRKFGLVAEPRPQPRIIKKKRKVILEDSSSEEDNEVTFCEAPPEPLGRKKHSETTTDATNSDDGHDGLAVRVREATDIRIAKTAQNDDDGIAVTLSINQLKRQHGVDNAQLEQGREQLEGEQIRSKMAADDEDMQEGFLGDMTIGKNVGGLADLAPLLKLCLTSRTELRKNERYLNDVDLFWEGIDRWAVFDESLALWKEHFQAMLQMRKDVSNELLDKSSNRAYTIRDNFREANIALGIDCTEIHEFFFSRLQKDKKPLNCSSTAASLLKQALSKVCQSCLAFAEGTFRTALNLVFEQERCCQHSSTRTIYPCWEKGQHFLLRGRANHNVGQAMYELARYNEHMLGRQQGKQHKPKDLLLKARKEFDRTVLLAKSLRRNAVSILGHANASGKSTQNADRSWTAEAIVHSLEALGLEALSSGFHVACSLKLDRVKEAQELFDGFVESVHISDVMSFVSVQGVEHHEIAEALEDVYYFAMRVAEMLTASLENVTTTKIGWNAQTGGKLLQMTCTAMKLAASISDELLPFTERHSLDNVKERITTRAAIEKEENEICSWWEATKVQACKKLSDIIQTVRENDARSTLPRRDIAASSRAVAPFPRRIFIQDDRSMQGRSPSHRMRRPEKTSAENRAVSERFNAEFCSENTHAIPGGRGACPPLEKERAKAKTATVYRKWGDEVLEERERERRCPPLPQGLSVDVRRALEKNLRAILPTSNGQLAGYVTS